MSSPAGIVSAPGMKLEDFAVVLYPRIGQGSFPSVVVSAVLAANSVIVTKAASEANSAIVTNAVDAAC